MDPTQMNESNITQYEQQHHISSVMAKGSLDHIRLPKIIKDAFWKLFRVDPTTNNKIHVR